MSLGQTTAVALALVSAMAIGIWISPFVMEPGSLATETAVITATDNAKSNGNGEARVVTTMAAVPVTSPDLQARLRPLLNDGARMDIAAEGFDSAEQFAAVAYAAHNTKVPFVLIKHRVLEEGMSLAEAIRASDEGIAADVEADRARAEARSVIATLTSAT